MVSLGNGNKSGAYFFEDDSDDQSTVSDSTPLVRRPTTQRNTEVSHTHLYTGYLTILEVIILLLYAGGLVGLQVWVIVDTNSTSSIEALLNPISQQQQQQQEMMQPQQQTLFRRDDVSNDAGQQDFQHNPNEPDLHKFVAVVCLAHVGVWLAVTFLDRVVQWRHQVLRRKGYLKFYRKMKNIRRIPFVIVSLVNAVLLIYISLLFMYVFRWNKIESEMHQKFDALNVLDIIVGLELLFTLPFLSYYIVQTMLFNCAANPPDVIRETYSGPGSPNNSVTTVGFRDGEDTDELLERQADMIRYLQQHNANLGRRILELQAQAME